MESRETNSKHNLIHFAGKWTLNKSNFFSFIHSLFFNFTVNDSECITNELVSGSQVSCLLLNGIKTRAWGQLEVGQLNLELAGLEQPIQLYFIRFIFPNQIRSMSLCHPPPKSLKWTWVRKYLFFFSHFRNGQGRSAKNYFFMSLSQCSIDTYWICFIYQSCPLHTSIMPSSSACRCHPCTKVFHSDAVHSLSDVTHASCSADQWPVFLPMATK